MATGGGAIERAREDLAAGRNWKARDRLIGFISTKPTNRDALELLGEVYRAMGDAPNAAAAWLLAGRVDADFQAAYAALEERCGGDPALILRALPLKGRIEDFPEEVQLPVADLARASAELGGIPRRTWRWLEPAEEKAKADSDGRTLDRQIAEKLGCLAIWLIIAVILSAFLVGFGLEFALAVDGLRSLGIDTDLVFYGVAALLVLWLGWKSLGRIRQATRSR